MTDSLRNQRVQGPHAEEDEIDFREFFRVLWIRKWTFLVITFAVTATAVVVVLTLPNIYTAEALLAPNDQKSAGGLSALAAQYGGLASLAGINLGGSGTDKTSLGLEILKSRKFVSEFVERHDILVPLMAAEGWDSDSGDLIIDPDKFDVASETWVRQVSPPRKTIPSSQEAYEEFVGVLSIGRDKATGFVTIAVEHYSPTIAKQWVDQLIDDLNSTIMQQDVAEAEQAIEYLKGQIEITPLAGLQNVFFSLIEEQTKTVLLAKVTDEYLLKTVDPAVAPETKSRPKRSLIVIFSALFGSFLAVAVVLASTSLTPKKLE